MKLILKYFFLFVSLCWSLSAIAEYREPHVRLSYLEELFNGIRSFPEDERYLYLSYTSFVNYEYRRILNQVLITESAIERHKQNGTPESDLDYRSKLNDLNRYKQYLNKETERFLSYIDLEIEIGKKALNKVMERGYSGWLRIDYFNIITSKLLVEELLQMKDDELFLYLRDEAPVNYGYQELVDEMIVKQSILSQVQDEWTEKQKEHYLKTEAELEKIMAGLRKEADRIIKFYAVDSANAERAFETAVYRLEEEQKLKSDNI